MNLLDKLLDWLILAIVLIAAPVLMVAGLVWFAASWGVVLNLW